MNRPHPKGRRPTQINPEWETKARDMTRIAHTPGDDFLDWACEQVKLLPEEDRDDAESGLNDKVLASESLRQAWIDEWFPKDA